MFSTFCCDLRLTYTWVHWSINTNYVSVKPSSVSKHNKHQKQYSCSTFLAFKDAAIKKKKKSEWSNIQIHCIRFTLCSSLWQGSLTWDKGSLERTKKGHNQSCISGTVSKAMMGKFLRVTMDIMWAFLSTQIPTWDEPNWTELKSLLCHTETKISYLRQVCLTETKSYLRQRHLTYNMGVLSKTRVSYLNKYLRQGCLIWDMYIFTDTRISEKRQGCLNWKNCVLPG